jgi:hypothetical protein
LGNDNGREGEGEGEREGVYNGAAGRGDFEGIDFKASGGKLTGRYTNGRTIGDIVGKSLALFI